jgi:predicted acylesterase/phospholipase RssA
MSITIVQKSDLDHPKKNPKIALVLAGGAISGGAFKVGGLVALNKFLKNRKITEFDLHVGISAGAFLGAFIASGIPPEEMLRSLEGNSHRLTQFAPTDFYNPNWKEICKKLFFLIRDSSIIWPQIASTLIRFIPGRRDLLTGLLKNFLGNPTYVSFEKLSDPFVKILLEKIHFAHPSRYIPSGLMDNSTIEKFVRINLERNHLPNNFKLLNKERGVGLYICATNLNTSRGVVFGHDSDSTVSISEAVQASTAIPVYYKPARLRGEDFVDGQVRKTANLSLAVHKGADLIICYNPFRPFVNLHRYQISPIHDTIADMGIFTILNQALRTLMHTRIHLSLDKLKLDPKFRGDVILIEPAETDAEFFSLNPLAFWNRKVSLIHGFESVKHQLERNFPSIERLFNAYALECDLKGLEQSLEEIKENEPPIDTGAIHSEESEHPKRMAHLRLVT